MRLRSGSVSLADAAPPKRTRSASSASKLSEVAEHLAAPAGAAQPLQVARVRTRSVSTSSATASAAIAASGAGIRVRSTSTSSGAAAAAVSAASSAASTSASNGASLPPTGRARSISTSSAGKPPAREITAHVGRFVDWMPEGIVAFAAHESRNWLALGRTTGDVELWESYTNGSIKQFVTIPGTSALNLKSLAWIDDRVFGCGLCGKVWEVDVARREVVLADSYGGAVWCMRTAPLSSGGNEQGGPRVLALACDDGRVRLARPLELQPGLEVDSPLLGGSKQRLLAVCWCGSDGLFASGVDGTIRRWSVQANRVTQTITVPSLGRGSPPTVWALDAQDEYLVSGDSLGRVSVWDCATGAMLQSFNEHQADVLTVCLRDDVVLAAGVDPRVSSFRKADMKWVYAYSHRPHTHDVHALCVLNGRVFSGGIDSQLCSVPLAGFESARPRKDASPARAVFLSDDGESGRILLVTHHSSIELWSIDASDHKLLVKMDFKGEALYSACLSRNARLLATSDTRFGLAMMDLAIDLEAEEPTVTVTKAPTPQLAVSHGAPVKMAFASDDTLLVCAMQSGSVAIISQQGSVLRLFDQGAGSCVQALAISPDGQWLASACFEYPANEAIHIYSLDGLVHHVSLPHALLSLHARQAAMSFVPQSSDLILARCDGTLVRYHVEERRLASGVLKSPNADILSLTFNPCDADKRIFTWGMSALCAVDPDSGRSSTRKLAMTAHVAFLSSDTVFVLLAPWIKMAARHLPDVMDRKRFGG